jgi:hypothetical protein
MGNCVGAGERAGARKRSTPAVRLGGGAAPSPFQQREENEAALFKGGLAPSAVAAYGGALRGGRESAQAQVEERQEPEAEQSICDDPVTLTPALCVSPRRKSMARKSLTAGAAPLAAATPLPAPHDERAQHVPQTPLELHHNVPYDSPLRKSRARKSKSRKSKSRNSAERDGDQAKRSDVHSSSSKSSQSECSLQSTVSRPPSESSLPRPLSEGPLGRSWDRVQAAKVGSESRVSRGQSLVSIPAYVAASARA